MKVGCIKRQTVALKLIHADKIFFIKPPYDVGPEKGCIIDKVQQKIFITIYAINLIMISPELDTEYLSASPLATAGCDLIHKSTNCLL